jgi:hypothetical protein
MVLALALTSTVLAAEPVTWNGVRFELGGYAQVDGVLSDAASVDELDPSTGQPLNQVAIVLKRARVRVEATRWIFGAQLELDANTIAGPQLRLLDAEAFVRWPAEGDPLLKLSAGLMRVPFGADVRIDGRDRAFLEPATLANALFPGSFDLGLQLSGGWKHLRWQVALMSGEPVAQRALPAADPNAAKDFIGRLSAVGQGSVGSFDVGASALTGTGFHAGTPSTKDRLVWVDGNEDGLVQLSELQVIGGLPATASQNFDRFALGADARVTVEVPRLGPLELRGEFVWSKNLDRGLVPADPIASSRPIRELGWSASVTQSLPWGFLVGVRHDRYDPDADAFEFKGATRVPVNQTVATTSVVASWHWERTARVMLQFDRQTNAFGRAADGSPTTLGGTRLTLRLEAGF